jgi:hypothetical protein
MEKLGRWQKDKIEALSNTDQTSNPNRKNEQRMLLCSSLTKGNNTIQQKNKKN